MKRINLTALLCGLCATTALIPLSSCNQKKEDKQHDYSIKGIDPNKINCNKQVLDNGNWQFTLSLKSGTGTIDVTNVKIGTNTLNISTDYTYDNNILTINKSALDKYDGDILITIDVVTTDEYNYLVEYENVYTTFMNNVGKKQYTQDDITNSNITGTLYEENQDRAVIRDYDSLSTLQYSNVDNAAVLQWNSTEAEWTVASVGKGHTKDYMKNKFTDYKKQGLNLHFEIKDNSINYKVKDTNDFIVLQEWTFNKFGYLTYAYDYCATTKGSTTLKIKFQYKVDPHAI